MYYNTLNSYLKERFGRKIYKLALSGNFTCPNRDGKISSNGCIFCSNGGSGDFAADRQLSIFEQIESAKEKVSSKITDGKYIAYFQSFTNTYGDINYMKQIFTEAISHPDIVALSIGTRPDCLPTEVLDLLEELNKIKPVWIELGLQTIHEHTATHINRGYELSIFNQAVDNLNKLNIDVIVHLIIGLPGESKKDMLESINYISHMNIAGVKLQLLHVLKNTPLAKEYLLGKFEVLSMEEYVDIIAECINYLPPNIVIHRITGDGPKSILIAPQWSGNKKVVLNYINKRFNELNVVQGSKYYCK